MENASSRSIVSPRNPINSTTLRCRWGHLRNRRICLLLLDKPFINCNNKWQTWHHDRMPWENATTFIIKWDWCTYHAKIQFHLPSVWTCAERGIPWSCGSVGRDFGDHVLQQIILGALVSAIEAVGMAFILEMRIME